MSSTEDAKIDSAVTAEAERAPEKPESADEESVRAAEETKEATAPATAAEGAKDVAAGEPAAEDAGGAGVGAEPVDSMDEFGMSPLMRASSAGDVSAVEALLKRGADVNWVSPKTGQTALMEAAWRGRLAVVRKLGEAGADRRIRNRQERIAEEIAYYAGHTAVTFDIRTWYVGLTGEYRNSHPLFKAIWEGNLEELKKYPEECRNRKNARGNTPMDVAAMRGDPRIVKWLLDLGVGVTGAYDFAPIHYAARAGHLAVVRLLMKHGAKGDQVLKMTPFLYALHEGHGMVAYELYWLKDSWRSRPNWADRDRYETGTLILACMAAGGVPLMKALYSAYWDSQNARSKNEVDKSGQTPLTAAAEANRPAAVRYLIEKFEPDLTVRRADGLNAVDVAIRFGHHQVLRELRRLPKFDEAMRTPIPASLIGFHDHVEALIQMGFLSAYQELRAGDGVRSSIDIVTDVMTMIKWNQYDMVAHMTKSFDMNIPDGTTRTPLMFAAQCGHAAIVRLLIDVGVDVNKTTEHGRTALGFAKKYNRDEVAKILIDAGADENMPPEHPDAAELFDSTPFHVPVMPECTVERANYFLGGHDLHPKSREAMFIKQRVRDLLKTPGFSVQRMSDQWQSMSYLDHRKYKPSALDVFL